jgi:uncharacterized protein (TIGR02099 family)
MSIASASNRWLNRIYKTLAIMLVLIAVLISGFRLFLPYVEHYRQDFQNYINVNNQTNIVIGGLGMSWQRSGPTLIANRVTLIDTDGAYVYVKHLEVQVDFWATLTKQRLISSNLILDGAIVTIENGAWGAREESNKDTSLEPNVELNSFGQITDVFLNRINRFSLKNSEVSIENNALERHFRINNLHWLNKGERHQAQGNIIVDELSSNNLKLKIDISGQSLDELEGMMYVEANHLDVAPWLDSVLSIEHDKIKADIGFSAWLKVKEGAIERLQLALHDNLISWQENIQIDGIESSISNNLALSAGQLLLVRGKKTDSFKMYSTPLLLQLNEEKAQEYIVQLNKTPENISVYLSSFDLALISQVFPLFVDSKNTGELLSELEISGQASDIFFKKTADDIQALASFADTSTKYSQGIPGIENISGSLSFTEQHLYIDLKAEQGSLDFDKHFVLPIPYESLQSTVDLSFKDDGWKLNVEEIELNSNELSLNADVTIESFENSPLTMSLLASIQEGDITKAGHYYPLTKMSSNLISYLNDSLIDGKMKQVQVLINGPLAKFPFTDKSGTFIVDAELEQATFRFSPDWPVIEDFNANLNFTNNSMLITGRSGSLTGLSVEGVQAEIDNLSNEQILTVDTLIKSSSALNVAKLMDESPLKNSVGSVLKQLEVQGNIDGEFHLNLPLNDTESVVASGLINFADNQVFLQTPRMNFDKVNGQLSFRNDKISTKSLSLNWRGLPLTLDVIAGNKLDYYDTSIKLNANWKNDTWMRHLSPSFKKYFEGQLKLTGDLSLYQHHGGGFSYKFNVGSNLAELAVNLPEPYTKLPLTETPLIVEVNGQLQQSTINATYGDQLSFFGVLDHDTTNFSRAHIVLGNEKMLLPMDGLHITTNLAQADVSEWQPFILDIINTTTQIKKPQEANGTVKGTALFSSPERIRGTIGELDILGQALHNVSFNFLDKTHWWLLELNAKETRSQIKFYPDWLEQGIDINADFIHLLSPKSDVISEQAAVSSPKSEESSSLIDEKVFDNIPQIKFSCERCQIDNLHLGKVDFSLVRNDANELQIENFKAKREQAELNLSGTWEKLSTQSETSIEGELSLKNIEYELEQLGYGSIIRDSGGKLAFNLNWLGGPHDFSFSHLNGSLNAKVDDGYLAEVSDKARIFSVLSLQSIVRKLTLDFRYIFSDGMFYKDIKGDYNIKEGVLYTDNTRMNGSAGDLYIKGNTSFVSNDIDYHISYKPNLTSSLPVLAWIATLNPVVFLAGVAIDQVITSQVVSEFNFELTGSVSNPNFKEVNRKSRDVSVGRSKPPEFVDSSDKAKSSPKETTINKSFKEFKSPSLIEDEQKPFNEDHLLDEFNHD